MYPKIDKPTVNKALILFPIYFSGKSSFALRNKLNKLMREFYPQILVRVIFKSKRNIGSFFKFKDRVPAELQSAIIYKYSCSCCNATYIGKTKRQAKVRYFEHLGKSIRTNRPLSKPPFSAIRLHSHDNDHPIQLDSFKILSSRTTDMELTTAESLYTIKEKPTLGYNERSVEMLCF